MWGHRAGRSGRPGSGWTPLLLPTASTRPPRLGGSLLGLLGGSAPGSSSPGLLTVNCQALLRPLRLPPAAGWTPGWEGREELHVSPAEGRGSGWGWACGSRRPSAPFIQLCDGAGLLGQPPALALPPLSPHLEIDTGVGLQGSHNETDSSLPRPAVGTATRFNWHHDL